MAECTFTVPFNGDAEIILGKARRLVEKQGGLFDGDINSGSFSLSVFGNSIAGSYSVSGNELSMVVSEKPFMVPCSMIENMLRSELTK